MITIDAFNEFLIKIDNPSQRERIEEVLSWVSETFPQLNKEIKWNQPMFIDHGTYIIGFSLAKQHMAVAPEGITITKFAEKISKTEYTHTKQLFRIGWDQPVDYNLLEEIIQFNIEDKADATNFWR